MIGRSKSAVIGGHLMPSGNVDGVRSVDGVRERFPNFRRSGLPFIPAKERGTEVYSIHPGPIATDMGTAAGLEDIAEPPSLVGEALVAAMAKGEFHVFPDSMAKQIGEAYAGFAAGVIEAAGGEG